LFYLVSTGLTTVLLEAQSKPKREEGRGKREKGEKSVRNVIAWEHQIDFFISESSHKLARG